MRSSVYLLLLGLGVVLSPGVANAEEFPYVFLEDVMEEGEEYSLYYELAPAKAWTRKGGARIAFDVQDEGNLRYATFSLGRLAVVHVAAGKSRDLAQTKAFRPEGPVRASIQRRSGLVRVIVDDMVLLSVPLPPPSGGKVGAGSRGGHVNCRDGLVQPVVPVYFADDFVRGAGETAMWETISGTWENTELTTPSADPGRAADPFSFRCSAPTGGLAAAGHWFWDDYRAGASVRPISAEAVGLCAYLQDADNYLVFRWLAGEDTAPKARQLVLVTDGSEQVLAQDAGGFAQGQWYGLGLEVGDGVAVCRIDRDEVLRAKTDAFGQGRVALWAEGQAVSFDDVRVVSPRLRPRPLPVNEEYLQDPVMSAEGLYNANGQWRADKHGVYWHRGVFFGELSVRLPAQLARAGHVQVFPKAAEPDPRSGYVAVVAPEGNGIKVTVRRGDSTLSQRQGALGDEEYVEVAWKKGRLSVFIGQDEVVSIPAAFGPGGRHLAVAGLPRAVASAPARSLIPEVASVGVAVIERALTTEFPVAPPGNPLSLVEVAADNWLDYTFVEAPTDWYATKGDWRPDTRWPCKRDWTFLTGDHDENPVAWTKHAYEGDIAFEVRTNIQADLRKSPGYSDPSDLDLALCGDGVNLDSGYAFIYAGWGNSRSAILRKGQIVAENADAVFDNPSTRNLSFHRHWFRLRAEKLGSKIRFLCDDKLICEYTDPHPLPGGRAAIWSAGNNPMVARAQLWYEKERPAPLPRLPGPPPLREPAKRGNAAAIADGFERDMGEWSTPAKPISARLDLDETTAIAGRRSLKITNLRPGGPMLAYALSEGFRADQWRRLSFGYRIPPEVRIDVYLYLDGAWHAFQLTGGTRDKGSAKVLGSFPNVQADGKWHHAEVDLLPPLQNLYPQRRTFRVDYLAFASPEDRYLRCGIGGNPLGATYWLDEFHLGP
ncbi:MAG: hypothetical protein ACE5R4_01295 [Armatimonadota bacterium]